MIQKIAVVIALSISVAAASPTLVERVQGLQKSEWNEKCDFENSAKILELAQVLDQHKDEIARLDKLLPLWDETERVENKLLEILMPFRPRTTWQLGWRSWAYGWKNTFRDYEAQKNKPISRAWSWINANALSLLNDDEGRILWRGNFSLGPDSASELRAIQDSIKTCLGDSSCDEAQFGSDLLEKLKKYTSYRHFIVPKGNHERRRARLRSFLEFLERDLKRYAFDPNPTIKRVSASELVLPLDFGPLESLKGGLIEKLEHIWSSSDLHLTIKPQSSALGAYAVKLFEHSGDRAFVSKSDKQIWIPRVTPLGPLAHEFGHVLGFPDHYFEVWDPEQCEYRVYVNADDIMSLSVSGSVTEDEFRQLDASYTFHDETR